MKARKSLEQGDSGDLCDVCSSEVATVVCEEDHARLCCSCDTQVHSANRVANRHTRWPLCGVCRRVKATKASTLLHLPGAAQADQVSVCSPCAATLPKSRKLQKITSPLSAPDLRAPLGHTAAQFEVQDSLAEVPNLQAWMPEARGLSGPGPAGMQASVPDATMSDLCSQQAQQQQQGAQQQQQLLQQLQQDMGQMDANRCSMSQLMRGGANDGADDVFDTLFSNWSTEALQTQEDAAMDANDNNTSAQRGTDGTRFDLMWADLSNSGAASAAAGGEQQLQLQQGKLDSGCYLQLPMQSGLPDSPAHCAGQGLQQVQQQQQLAPTPAQQPCLMTPEQQEELEQLEQLEAMQQEQQLMSQLQRQQAALQQRLAAQEQHQKAPAAEPLQFDPGPPYAQGASSVSAHEMSQSPSSYQGNDMRGLPPAAAAPALGAVASWQAMMMQPHYQGGAMMGPGLSTGQMAMAGGLPPIRPDGSSSNGGYTPEQLQLQQQLQLQIMGMKAQQLQQAHLQQAHQVQAQQQQAQQQQAQHARAQQQQQAQQAKAQQQQLAAWQQAGLSSVLGLDQGGAPGAASMPRPSSDGTPMTMNGMLAGSGASMYLPGQGMERPGGPMHAYEAALVQAGIAPMWRTSSAGSSLMAGGLPGMGGGGMAPPLNPLQALAWAAAGQGLGLGLGQQGHGVGGLGGYQPFAMQPGLAQQLQAQAQLHMQQGQAQQQAAQQQQQQQSAQVAPHVTVKQEPSSCSAQGASSYGAQPPPAYRASSSGRNVPGAANLSSGGGPTTPAPGPGSLPVVPNSSTSFTATSAVRPHAHSGTQHGHSLHGQQQRQAASQGGAGGAGGGVHSNAPPLPQQQQLPALGSMSGPHSQAGGSALQQQQATSSLQPQQQSQQQQQAMLQQQAANAASQQQQQQMLMQQQVQQQLLSRNTAAMLSGAAPGSAANSLHLQLYAQGLLGQLQAQGQMHHPQQMHHPLGLTPEALQGLMGPLGPWSMMLNLPALARQQQPLVQPGAAPTATTAGNAAGAGQAPPSTSAVLPEHSKVSKEHLERGEALTRYRQKRKTRHFEKTIRYASRQIRAHKRPRIKGRFVKQEAGCQAGHGNSLETHGPLSSTEEPDEEMDDGDDAMMMDEDDDDEQEGEAEVCDEAQDDDGGMIPEASVEAEAEASGPSLPQGPRGGSGEAGVAHRPSHSMNSRLSAGSVHTPGRRRGPGAAGHNSNMHGEVTNTDAYRASAKSGLGGRNGNGSGTGGMSARNGNGASGGNGNGSGNCSGKNGRSGNGHHAPTAGSSRNGSLAFGLHLPKPNGSGNGGDGGKGGPHQLQQLPQVAPLMGLSLPLAPAQAAALGVLGCLQPQQLRSGGAAGGGVDDLLLPQAGSALPQSSSPNRNAMGGLCAMPTSVPSIASCGGMVSAEVLCLAAPPCMVLDCGADAVAVCCQSAGYHTEQGSHVLTGSCMEDNHTLVEARGGAGQEGAGDGEGDSECCSAEPQVSGASNTVPSMEASTHGHAQLRANRHRTSPQLSVRM